MVETLRRFDPGDAAIDRRRPTSVLIVPVRERFDDDERRGVRSIDFLGAVARRARRSSRSTSRSRSRRGRSASSSRRATRDAAARGHVVALPPDDGVRHVGRPRAARTGRRAAARGAGASTRTARASATSRCQPAMEFRGRVNDWVAEIRQARERGDTVLFVADSHGRAERTVEILQEYDIVAVPVERAEDAHAAAVLVAVGSLSRGFRLADAALQIYAETDVFEEERRAVREAPQPRQDVPLRPARPEGRRPRRPRRPRHRRVRRPEAARRSRQPTRRSRSSSSCAITATTSCSSRSSGST